MFGIKDAPTIHNEIGMSKYVSFITLRKSYINKTPGVAERLLNQLGYIHNFFFNGSPQTSPKRQDRTLMS